ncbi:3-deoxy-manno-octulosonate cytidylyltransferase (CMP-KDO synthetase) [Rhizomicrobium palustre]|uniref:3-deoxy-manno-octulosonate cytidylyltransferase (CMP-KDO synthetase) n=1 Tax=Rhizomicrobium palustre TaxID=189966 RepID=A0A846MWH4_9PROT|nr:3-deoxy-manno-octulosonate cytidylyltransferase [Rhizomicrobium palustre]NIK87874.1 3-deoxy-manno-octulosonate cytidylyltransferase (CMP-KDO synthetase) [Rhizomicrobium palustre]
MKPIILIPARMASTRLPGKPLADIGGVPMIVRVWQKAVETGVGPVVVACSEPEVQKAIEAAGGRAILTKPELPSGSDRVWAALNAVDRAFEHDLVVNLQGDLPTFNPAIIKAAIDAMVTTGADIGTCAAEIEDEKEADNPSVVKVVATWDVGGTRGKAHYFTRAKAPWGKGPWFHHVGIYAYRREALQRFINLLPSPLEGREKLEQLRAIEAGMTIAVGKVDEVPSSVDTPADLEKARAQVAKEKKLA